MFVFLVRGKKFYLFMDVEDLFLKALDTTNESQKSLNELLLNILWKLSIPALCRNYQDQPYLQE